MWVQQCVLQQCQQVFYMQRYKIALTVKRSLCLLSLLFAPAFLLAEHPRWWQFIKIELNWFLWRLLPVPETPQTLKTWSCREHKWTKPSFSPQKRSNTFYVPIRQINFMEAFTKLLHTFNYKGHSKNSKFIERILLRLVCLNTWRQRGQGTTHSGKPITSIGWLHLYDFFSTIV